MSISRVKTWTAETLTASDLNSEFNNIINNALSLISPLTATLDIDNQRLDDIHLGTVGDPSLNFNGDSNTGFYSPAADQFAISVGGTQAFVSTTTYTNFPDLVFINDTANTNSIIGLTIQIGANDDTALALKSSDVGHAMTALAEADTFGALLKAADTSGGLHVVGYKDANGAGSEALTLRGRLGEAADTTTTTSGIGVINLVGQVTDAGTSVTVVADAGNIVSMRNSGTTRWIILGNGDVHQTTDAHTALDEWDDAALCRAWDLDRAPKAVILDEWDKFNKYKRKELIEAGIYNSYDQDELYNASQLTRLHNGAIGQLAKKYMRLEKRLLALEGPHA